ncbi:MAG: biotin--[acetyl-CoA-carboxylase] ligase [Verrucomicrobia bacterium 61-8]|nr:biotin--[acetyl-CoA-carboxylase] ligase [Verrucomicrobiota bacterium]OJU98929.1 MAG: biotin--[acetyl-CoA-carboxylase] ligase [Verrucomicrobia bacterium 61-8]
MTLLDPDLIQAAAGEGTVGKRVLVFRETASTNDLLLRMGESGEPEGTVVFAESQTAGRGRFKRPWHSAVGLGLWFSFLVREGLGPAVTDLTPLIAVAMSEGLRDATCDGRWRIKPPNDIYGDSGKVAGILIEARSGPRPFAVIGIGLNVNHAREDFPTELRASASSLRVELDRVLDREKVAGAVLAAVNRHLCELGNPQAAFLKIYDRMTREWQASRPALQSPEV